MNSPHAQIAFRVALALAAAGLGGAFVAALVGVVLSVVGPSGGDVIRLCGKTDVAPAGGSDYLGQNNVWGADTQ